MAEVTIGANPTPLAGGLVLGRFVSGLLAGRVPKMVIPKAGGAGGRAVSRGRV